MITGGSLLLSASPSALVRLQFCFKISQRHSHCCYAGMGMPRPMQPRPGMMAGSPQLGGGLLSPQALAASRMAVERQQQGQQLQQTQQALAMMQPAGQLPPTFARPQGFPGPGGFPGPMGPGFPGPNPRYGPPRPQVFLNPLHIPMSCLPRVSLMLVWTRPAAELRTDCNTDASHCGHWYFSISEITSLLIHDQQTLAGKGSTFMWCSLLVPLQLSGS